MFSRFFCEVMWRNYSVAAAVAAAVGKKKVISLSMYKYWRRIQEENIINSGSSNVSATAAATVAAAFR